MFTGGGASPVVIHPSKGWLTEVIFHPGMGLSNMNSMSSIQEMNSSTNSRSEANYCPTDQKVCTDQAESKSDCINEDSNTSSRIANAKNTAQIFIAAGMEKSLPPVQEDQQGICTGIAESNNNYSSRMEEKYKRGIMGKLPSSKYKGVVPQPNGRWGAQIYEKHSRVWLGTYNTEEQAAHVYDIAVFKFRGRDAVTNFASLDEPCSIFLLRFSKSEIVDMLRKRTFADELQQFPKQSNSNRTDCSSLSQDPKLGPSEIVRDFPREHLFDKILTPSDVGKLNRIVIPKQCAEKYFPLCDFATGKGILLHFLDSTGKKLQFRYSYWTSSQSYVFTKGWNRFVKEKGLQAGDIVHFERASLNSGQFYITFHRRTSSEFNMDTAIGCPQKSSPPPVHNTSRYLPCDILRSSHAYCLQFGLSSLPRESLKCSPANGCIKSASDESNASCLEFQSLVRQLSPLSSSYSSGVMVFGANLRQSSPPVTLDLFPFTEAEKACRTYLQEKKRKWEGLDVHFYARNKQPHNVL